MVDTGYGLGRSWGYCGPALPKDPKYQMIKTQTEPRDKAISLNKTKADMGFLFLRVFCGTSEIGHAAPWWQAGEAF